MMREEKLRKLRKSIQAGLNAVNELIALYVALSEKEKL